MARVNVVRNKLKKKWGVKVDGDDTGHYFNEKSAADNYAKLLRAKYRGKFS